MDGRARHWLLDPSPRTGMYFAGPRDGWDFWPYDRLALQAARVARGLIASGVPRHGRVLLVQRSGVEFMATLYGSMLAGAVPSPISPPAAYSEHAAYGDHLANVIRTSRPTVLITDDDLVPVLPVADLSASLAGGPAPRVIGFSDLLAAGTDGTETQRPPADLALITYTSGSTGHCRGVRVPHAALDANTAAITVAAGWSGTGSLATWLPPHHDMGLIGTLFAGVTNQLDLWVMSPQQFIRDPLRYLRCLATNDTRWGASPTFGLDYIARKVKPAAVADLDFSAVRGVFVGAERVDAAVLDRFLALTGPRGFPATALLPSYGCAETTLVITAKPLDEPWSSVRVDPAGLAMGEKVRPVGADEPGQDVVACGRPVTGMRVSVLSEDGTPLPDGVVGEILAEGTSVADGYAEDPAREPATTLGGGRFLSGDAGFLLDGRLYVLGRLGDSLKVRGRSLFAEDVEGALIGAGVPANRVTALLGVHRGVPTAVILFEQFQDDWRTMLTRTLAARLEGVEQVVLRARPGAVARTSSGKPKRRQLWRAFTDGTLQATDITGTEAK